MLDLKISSGTILDGTGCPARPGDVGVQGDRIVAVGDLRGVPAREEINAAGHLVCPGFIDVHSHSDAYLLIEPAAPSKVFQGVTTEIVGQCGASAAPRQGEYRMPSDWRGFDYPGSWSTVAEYRALLESVGPAPNVVLLVGHSALRASVMGYAQRPATPTELAAMEVLLEQSLAQGGRGFSTGLIYPPGKFAARDEIVALARIAARHGGVYASHMRSEGSGLLAAIDEALDIGRQAGTRVQISHLKVAGRENWPLRDPALERIAAARAAGQPVMADRYPYTASCTELDILLPDWAAEGGMAATLERLADPGTRARLHDELAHSRNPDYWATVMIGSTEHPDNLPYKGQYLPAVAQALGLDPAAAVLELLARDQLKTTGVFFGMHEENMWTILRQPYVMIGSDGSLRAPTGPLSHDHPHPRNYGTFPRFLRAALDGHTVPLAEAVHKCTLMAARQFNLAGRGEIREKCFADLVVLDPHRVRDLATYTRPHQLAEGVTALVVNGVLTMAGGRLTGRRGGRVLA